jgi:flavin-dependent dehydrogenase
MKFEDVDLSGPPRLKGDDIPIPLLCVRRITLDARLVEMAKSAGVDLRLNTRVTSLLMVKNRVVGVKVSSHGVTSEIYADLLVGADGRLSTIARLVGSRRYHVIPSERMSSWAYFSDVKAQPEAKIYYHRKGDDFVVAAPADDGLFIVATCPSVEHFESYRSDSEGLFQSAVNGCAPVAEILSTGKRITKFRGLTRFEGYFREATGPGWVLVGDSGHFKDPTPGQGISDALRQVEKLAVSILYGFSKPADRDLALREWWRWRDRDALQHYWLCSDIGKRGPMSPVRLEILRKFAKNDELRMDFLDLFLHRRYPRQVFTPTELFAATFRLLANPERRKGAVKEAMHIIGEDWDRRFQARFPRFTSSKAVDEPHLDHKPSTQLA